MRLCVCRLKPYETEVMSGMAVTPRDMERMTATGRAIASQSLEQFCYNDGLQNPSDLPVPFRRGVSLNDAWEISELVRAKARDAVTHRELQAARRKLSKKNVGDDRNGTT